jgi:hypothetical protein
VFARNGTTWSQQAYLKASNTGTNDNFGRSVSISVDTIVVGAIGEASSTTGVNSTPDESASGSGAAYVFARNGTTWSQQAYLKASNTGAGDRFGVSVAVSGDTVVVGADSEASSRTGVNSSPDDNLAAFSGSAYVFVRSGTTWSQQAYLKASNTGANDSFGQSVSISGDTVVLGANNEDSSTTGVNSTPNESSLNSGAAYIFVGLGPLLADIAVTQAAAVSDEGSIAFDTVPVNTSGTPLTFTIENTGPGNLTLGTITKDGSNPSDFTVNTSGMLATVTPGNSTTFTVTFSPSGEVSGMRTADIQISSNVIGSKNPFDIALAGQALSFATDTDADGLNDASEFQMATLGFDWEVSQPALVSTYHSSANGAGYFSASQVQALNVDTPLIQRNPNTGVFTLTIGIEKSTTLSPGSFLPFSMLTAPGAATSLNGAGKLEFQFTSPENAAFYRIETK